MEEVGVNLQSSHYFRIGNSWPWDIGIGHGVKLSCGIKSERMTELLAKVRQSIDKSTQLTSESQKQIRHG